MTVNDKWSLSSHDVPIPIHPGLPSQPPSLRGAQRRGSPAINPNGNYNLWIASLRSQRRVLVRKNIENHRHARAGGHPPPTPQSPANNQNPKPKPNHINAQP